mmetsp:Transcript_27322/g.62981  ORF Transcript_27322/g.62981 Transcript_27322/m.62981 type:complete len:189 (+) Transcript_27322:71-637(+)
MATTEERLQRALRPLVKTPYIPTTESRSVPQDKVVCEYCGKLFGDTWAKDSHVNAKCKPKMGPPVGLAAGIRQPPATGLAGISPAFAQGAVASAAAPTTSASTVDEHDPSTWDAYSDLRIAKDGGQRDYYYNARTHGTEYVREKLLEKSQAFYKQLRWKKDKEGGYWTACGERHLDVKALYREVEGEL